MMGSWPAWRRKGKGRGGLGRGQNKTLDAGMEQTGGWVTRQEVRNDRSQAVQGLQGRIKDGGFSTSIMGATEGTLMQRNTHASFLHRVSGQGRQELG